MRKLSLVLKTFIVFAMLTAGTAKTFAQVSCLSVFSDSNLKSLSLPRPPRPGETLTTPQGRNLTVLQLLTISSSAQVFKVQDSQLQDFILKIKTKNSLSTDSFSDEKMRMEGVQSAGFAAPPLVESGLDFALKSGPFVMRAQDWFKGWSQTGFSATNPAFIALKRLIETASSRQLYVSGLNGDNLAWTGSRWLVLDSGSTKTLESTALTKQTYIDNLSSRIADPLNSNGRDHFRSQLLTRISDVPEESPPPRKENGGVFSPVEYSMSEAEQALLSLLKEATGHNLRTMDQIWAQPDIRAVMGRARRELPNVTALEALAVWMYTEAGYRIVNRPLRAGLPLNRQQQIFASLISSAVRKSPVVTTEVLRKATIPHELKEAYQQGRIVRYKSFLSTAQLYVSTGAMSHLKDQTDIVTFHIQPKGSAHAIENMSQQPIETEAVFLPGSTFKIKEINGLEIYLEEVDGNSLGYDFDG